MLIGEIKKKSTTAGNYCSLLKNEGQISPIYHNPPSVTKPATEMHSWHVLRSPQSPPPPRPHIPSKSPQSKEERNCWSLPLVLFNHCFVVQDVQEISPLFCHLKTLESVHMHCVLGKSSSCHFTYRHAYCVTNVGWHRTREFAFYSVATRLNYVLLFPKRPLFYLKRFLKGGKRCERKNYGFYCDNLSWYERAQMVLQCQFPVCYCWRRRVPAPSAVWFWSGRAAACVLSRETRLWAWGVSAWMLRICVQHTT